MTTWQERLAEEIILLSPEANEFTALWRGDDVDFEKRVGLFDFPGVNGTIVQDMGSKGDRYALTIYFDGPQHDLQAMAFFKSCSEKGKWQIIHPVLEYIELQLLTARMSVQPLSSGNITVFDMTWIEPLDEEVHETTRQLFGVVDENIADLNSASAQEYIDETDTTSFGLEHASGSTVSNQVDTVLIETIPLTSDDEIINDAVLTAQKDVENVAEITPLDTGVLAGLSQSAIQKSILGTQDLKSRTDALDRSVRGLLDDLDSLSEPSLNNKNKAVATQLSLLSLIAASAKTITTSVINTRLTAVETAEELIDSWSDIVHGLDNIQTVFYDSSIDKSFFTQSTTYSLTGKLVTSVVKLLLRAAYDLGAEKKWTLTEPCCPAFIVLAEFGSLGQGDQGSDFLDDFIDRNNLKGDEILLLPAGREVTINATV